MWAELILSRDDLAHLLHQALPVTIHLGEAGSDQSLMLSELAAVSLVADVGLRVECKARIHWPVLGIDVPINVSSLSVVLVPSIGRSDEGDTLVFRLTLEHADFSALPGLLDRRVTDAINGRLAERGAEFAWNFSKSLTLSAPLPALLEPLDRLALRPAWGKVRISEEAVVYAVSFHTALVRRGEAVPTEFEASSAPLTRPPLAAAAPADAKPARTSASSMPVAHLAKAGIFGLGAGAAYFVLKRFGSHR